MNDEKIYSLEEIKILENNHTGVKKSLNFTPHGHIDKWFYTQDCVAIKKELQNAYKKCL